MQSLASVARSVSRPAAGGAPVVLPLRDPLLGPDPSIEAVIPISSPPEASRPFWMNVSSTERAVLLREGKRFDPDDDRTVHKRDSAVVPTLLLGDVPLHDVLVTGADVNVIGQTMLSHGAWEIDWDRGTLTLDAPPWPADLPGAVHLPLRRRDGVDVVTMDAAGHSFEMALATGGLGSRIPDPVGSLLQFGDMLKPVRILEAEASIGGLPIGLRNFPAPVEGHEPHGVLGLDALGCFRVRVDPGKELALAPRQDSPSITRERVARWSMLRGCRDPGCVQARMERRQPPYAVAVDIETPYPRSSMLVLRCRDDATPVVSRSCDDRYRRYVHGLPLDLEPRQILVPIEKGAVGHVVQSVWMPPRFPSDWPCTELSVADVVPQRTSAMLGAMLWVWEAEQWWVSWPIPGMPLR